MNTLSWILIGVIVILIGIIWYILNGLGNLVECVIPKLPKEDNFFKKILKKFGILK